MAKYKQGFPVSDLGFVKDSGDHKRDDLDVGKKHQRSILRGPTGFPWCVDSASFGKSADSLASVHQAVAFEACYRKRRESVFAGYARALGTRLRAGKQIYQSEFRDICKLTKRATISGFEGWDAIAQEHRCFLIFLGELHCVVTRVIEEAAFVMGDLRTWDPWAVGAALDESKVACTNEVNIYQQQWTGAIPAMPQQMFLNRWQHQDDPQVDQLNDDIRHATKLKERVH